MAIWCDVFVFVCIHTYMLFGMLRATPKRCIHAMLRVGGAARSRVARYMREVAGRRSTLALDAFSRIGFDDEVGSVCPRRNRARRVTL